MKQPVNWLFIPPDNFQLHSTSRPISSSFPMIYEVSYQVGKISQNRSVFTLERSVFSPDWYSRVSLVKQHYSLLPAEWGTKINLATTTDVSTKQDGKKSFEAFFFLLGCLVSNADTDHWFSGLCVGYKQSDHWFSGLRMGYKTDGTLVNDLCW